MTLITAVSQGEEGLMLRCHCWQICDHKMRPDSECNPRYWCTWEHDQTYSAELAKIRN